MSQVGIIGGSGLYDMPGLVISGDRHVKTPFGEPSGPYRLGEAGGVRVAFLPRHGPAHTIPPHRINYRANLWGFRELGATSIISVNATGGIDPSFEPGDIVLADQVMDMTHGARESTFYDTEKVVHIDFTEPYCPRLRAALTKAADYSGLDVHTSGTYICVNGPRLESRAEIMHFGLIGAHIVGMTGMPEASLARELELCMAMVSVVTNRAAGTTGEKLTTVEVIEKMKESTERINSLLLASLPLLTGQRDCACKDALKGTAMGKEEREDK